MIPVFSEMTGNNREMILMKKFICGTLAAVMALWMSGCNMGQSDTVTTAEETNVKIRQLRRGQPIQVRSPKCQPHPSRWRQKQMVE